MRFRVEVLAHPEAIDVDADSAAAAVALVEARGGQVLRVSALDADAAIASRPARLSLLLFCQELLSLLEAGLSLPEAMPVLVAKERQPDSRAMLADILQLLRSGQSFSEALRRYPTCFPELFLAGIRASETTSGLPEALQRYIDYEQQFAVIRKKLVSASIYPAVLIVVGSLVGLFLIGYVVPRFSVVFESSGRDIPAMSRWLLDMGATLHAHWQAGLSVLVGLLGLMIFAALQVSVRQQVIGLLLKAPLLRERATLFFLSRFYRAVSLLLQSGLPLVKALTLARGLLGIEQQPRLDAAIRSIQEGQSCSVALARSQLSTVVADSLLAVGERSGRLPDMLARCAQFHDDELAREVDMASRLLEPILMTIIGVGVGAIVVLMYMPIFDLAGSLE